MLAFLDVFGVTLPALALLALLTGWLSELSLPSVLYVAFFFTSFVSGLAARWNSLILGMFRVVKELFD